VRGRALKFDGVDDQVTLDGSGSLAEVTDDSYTFAAWVQPDSIPPAASDNDTAYSILVRAYTGLYYDANQTFRAEILLADGTRTAVSSSEFSPNEWHHVAMTVDNAQHLLHLYVDGQEVGNSPVPYMGSLADHQDAPYYIGTSEPLTNRYEYRFSGLVDEVQIYNRALSPEEISHLFDWAAEDEPQFFCVHIPMIQKNKVAGASCGK
jgi:hypothetical protein